MQTLVIPAPTGQILFNMLGISVRWYSICLFIGALVAILVMKILCEKIFKGVKFEKIIEIIPIIIIAGVVGARIYYVLLDWSYYSTNLKEIFAIWHGGISIHGAILGGLVGLIMCARKMKFNFWSYADVMVLGLVIGQAVGRFGNYFNNEAFGLPCGNILCLSVPEINRPYEFKNVELFHPTFLYESIFDLIIFIGLSIYAKGHYDKVNSGVIFAIYLISYSVVRIIVEAYRIDSVLYIYGFSIAAIVSIIIIIIGVILLFLRQKTNTDT